MAELALITSKSLKACEVLDGHALRILDELKKRRALGVVPPKKPSKRPADISSFMDLRKKQQKKEAAHTVLLCPFSMHSLSAVFEEFFNCFCAPQPVFSQLQLSIAAI